MTATQPTSQTQTAAADAPAPQAAPTTARAAASVITIGGQQVDLANISVENGLAIYNALTPEQKRQADLVAGFVQNHERTLNVDIPQNLTLQNAFGQYMAAIRAGGGQLGSTAEGWMRQMDAAVGNQVRGQMREQIPGYTAAEAAGNTVSFLANTGSAAVETFFLVPLWSRGPGVIGNLFSEGSGAIGQGAGPEQSRAFAAVYVAAQADADRLNANPANSPMQTAATWIDSAVSWVQASFTWLMHTVPVIPQVFEWMFSGFGSWAEAGQQVQQKQAQELQEMGGNADIGSLQQHILQRNTTRSSAERTRHTASDILTAAGRVADLDAAPIAGLLANGGFYQRQDGTRARVRPLNGSEIQEETLVNPETRQPITRLDRVGNDISSLVPGNADGGSFDLASTAVGTVAGGALAVKYRVPQRIGGFINKIISPVTGLVTGMVGREVSTIGNAVEETRSLASPTSRAAGILTGSSRFSATANAAAPLLRRAGYAGVAIGAAGDALAVGNSAIHGDGAGVAVHGSELVGTAGGGVAGAIGGGSVGGWIGAGVGTAISGVVGFFSAGTGLVAAPVIISTSAAIGTVAGSFAGGWFGADAGRNVAGGTARALVGESAVDARNREQADASARVETARNKANGATGGFRWPWESASAAAPIQSQTAGIAMRPAGLPRGVTPALNIG